MKYLTRKEELVLLAIFQMKESAYLVNIRTHLNTNTDKKWTIGNVYVPLDRMSKIGLLESYVGESNAKRGGKAKKFYKLTRQGYDALLEIKKVNDVMWQGFDAIVYEE